MLIRHPSFLYIQLLWNVVLFFFNWLLFALLTHTNVCKMYWNQKPPTALYTAQRACISLHQLFPGSSKSRGLFSVLLIFYLQAATSKPRQGGAWAPTSFDLLKLISRFAPHNQRVCSSQPSHSIVWPNSNNRDRNHFLYVQSLQSLTSLIIQFLVLILF